MSKLSYQRQKGSAALLFLLIFPALFAVFVWGLEGARMLQTSARLKDATESAALAVAANQVLTNSTCNHISQSMIEAYFSPESTVAVAENVEGVTTPCVVDGLDTYTITASVTENTWFPNSNFASYGASFSATDSIQFIKDSGPIDVVIVANYASTMSKHEKDMEELVSQIADTLNQTNLPNTLGLVGFDHYVISKEVNWFIFFEYTRFTLSHNVSCVPIPYKLTSYCQDISYLSGWGDGSLLDFLKKVDVLKYLASFDEDYLFDANYIDAEKTIDSIFSSNSSNSWTSYQIGNFKINKIGSDKVSQYETLPLTSNISSIASAINENNRFKVAKGNKATYESASYTGLIEGARLAADGSNSRRLIILLTDGKEESPDIVRKLTNAGLCREITNTSNYQNTPKVELAMIGFDFDDSPSEGEAIKNCIGAGRTYQYSGNEESDQTMLDQVLDIRSQNIGRLVL